MEHQSFEQYADAPDAIDPTLQENYALYSVQKRYEPLDLLDSMHKRVPSFDARRSPHFKRIKGRSDLYPSF